MPITLQENEKIVFDVVREYLDKNRTFEIQKLLSFINSRFRMRSITINNEGIESILKSLVKKNLLVEGSKLTGDNILNNEKRKLIYKHVIQNPGIHLKRIINEIEFSFNVVIWHLNILGKFNFIKKSYIENRAIFYDSKLEFNEVKIYYFTSKDKSKKIIEYLKINDFGI